MREKCCPVTGTTANATPVSVAAGLNLSWDRFRLAIEAIG
jgi:hypothetical protein